MCAGYARYLTGVGDDGNAFELSPDPNLAALTQLFAGYSLGSPIDTKSLHALFTNAEIFGVDLYAHGLSKKLVDMFTEMSVGTGAIRATIDRYLEMV